MGSAAMFGHLLMMPCETVPGTGEVARFPAETLGTHKDGNTEYNVSSTGSPTATPDDAMCVILVRLSELPVKVFWTHGS
jgi:hypothetical protein